MRKTVFVLGAPSSWVTTDRNVISYRQTIKNGLSHQLFLSVVWAQIATLLVGFYIQMRKYEYIKVKQIKGKKLVLLLLSVKESISQSVIKPDLRRNNICLHLQK